MRPLPFRNAFVRMLIAWTLLGATAFCAGKGLVIYKDQPWVADEFADVVEYDQLEEYPNIFHLTTTQNQKISILTGNILKNVPYLELASLGQLMEPRDLARVSSAIRDMVSAAHQYPRSAKLLDPRIRQLQAAVDRFQKGEVMIYGTWQPSKEAALKLQKEREAAAAAADAEDLRQQEALRAAREKSAADARLKTLEQKEFLQKEALRKLADAKAAEEERRLVEESQAAEARRKEEQERIAEENRALDKRRIEYASIKMRDADRFTEEFDRPFSLAPARTLSVEKLPEVSHEQRAIGAAQTIVRKQLKTPLAARFEETRMLQEADPWYQLFVAVDAPNAIGVYVRETYVCTLKLGAGDEFSYDQSLGIQKMDEDAIKQDGVLGQIRAACGWRANPER
jgi:hypothetical protein